MRVVIMEPSKLWPRIVHMDDANTIQVAIGGRSISGRTVHHSGNDLWVITRMDADAAGLAPNRIVDGHCLYGMLVVCGYGMADMPLPVAKELQSNCAWPLARLPEPDTTIVGGRNMKTFYDTCPYCGAHLDPGEHCDCEKEETI